MTSRNAGRPHAVAIGERLTLARKVKRYEVEHVACKSGIGARSILRIECGEVLARTTTLQRIAPVLEVDLDWLELGIGKGPNR